MQGGLKLTVMAYDDDGGDHDDANADGPDHNGKKSYVTLKVLQISEQFVAHEPVKGMQLINSKIWNAPT